MVFKNTYVNIHNNNNNKRKQPKVYQKKEQRGNKMWYSPKMSQ